MSKPKTADWLKDKSWHRIRNDMLVSAAWKAASHLQRSMIFALLSELGRHWERNGRLIFTNANFEEFGVFRGSIKPNMAAIAALGFLAYTPGHPGEKGYGKARRCRLTFMPMLDAEGNEIEPPTDEWARFSTTKQAKMAAERARKRAKSSKNQSNLHTKSVCKIDYEDKVTTVG
jgi:hypothetical protein